jgi:hypothetical protein
MRTAPTVGAIVTSAIVFAALISGVRAIAYAALATLIVAGLWPILLLAGGVALLMLVSVVAGFIGGDGVGDVGLYGAGEGITHGGVAIATRYYRFLGASRHPVLWGAAGGLLAGTGIVWGVLALWVIPGEQKTLKTMLDVQSQLEDQYRRDGHYPPSDAGATIAGQSGPIVDGFGRPIRYRVDGAWKLASYTISSLGFDGRPSEDDLCITGGTRLGAWLQRASDRMHALREGSGLHPGNWSAKVDAIRSSRCAGTR